MATRPIRSDSDDRPWSGRLMSESLFEQFCYTSAALGGDGYQFVAFPDHHQSNTDLSQDVRQLASFRLPRDLDKFAPAAVISNEYPVAFRIRGLANNRVVLARAQYVGGEYLPDGSRGSRPGNFFAHVLLGDCPNTAVSSLLSNASWKSGLSADESRLSAPMQLKAMTIVTEDRPFCQLDLLGEQLLAAVLQRLSGGHVVVAFGLGWREMLDQLEKLEMRMTTKVFMRLSYSSFEFDMRGGFDVFATQSGTEVLESQPGIAVVGNTKVSDETFWLSQKLTDSSSYVEIEEIWRHIHMLADTEESSASWDLEGAVRLLRGIQEKSPQGEGFIAEVVHRAIRGNGLDYRRFLEQFLAYAKDAIALGKDDFLALTEFAETNQDRNEDVASELYDLVFERVVVPLFRRKENELGQAASVDLLKSFVPTTKQELGRRLSSRIDESTLEHLDDDQCISLATIGELLGLETSHIWEQILSQRIRSCHLQPQTEGAATELAFVLKLLEDRGLSVSGVIEKAEVTRKRAIKQSKIGSKYIAGILDFVGSDFKNRDPILELIAKDQLDDQLIRELLAARLQSLSVPSAIQWRTNIKKAAKSNFLEFTKRFGEFTDVKFIQKLVFEKHRNPKLGMAAFSLMVRTYDQDGISESDFAAYLSWVDVGLNLDAVPYEQINKFMTLVMNQFEFHICFELIPNAISICCAQNETISLEESEFLLLKDHARADTFAQLVIGRLRRALPKIGDVTEYYNTLGEFEYLVDSDNYESVYQAVREITREAIETGKMDFVRLLFLTTAGRGSKHDEENSFADRMISDVLCDYYNKYPKKHLSTFRRRLLARGVDPNFFAFCEHRKQHSKRSASDQIIQNVRKFSGLFQNKKRK